jgi:hypothetical protein
MGVCPVAVKIGKNLEPLYTAGTIGASAIRRRDSEII